MIPIPNHLQALVHAPSERSGQLSFSLRCGCGCEAFSLLESETEYTSEQKRKKTSYFRALEEACRGAAAVSFTWDQDGTGHTWVRKFPLGPKTEVFLPEEPKFAEAQLLKARCAACGAETVLFDASVHGWDGRIAKANAPVSACLPFHWRKMGQKDAPPAPVRVKIENDPTYEAFCENAGAGFSEEDYSEAFTWIQVQSRSATGKWTTRLDVETA